MGLIGGEKGRKRDREIERSCSAEGIGSLIQLIQTTDTLGMAETVQVQRKRKGERERKRDR